MQTVLIVLRLGLAGVFATAGVGKLLDREGSRDALVDFGVPQEAARIGAIALPVAELVVTAGLVLRPTAQWAAAGAGLLLLLFIAGISRALGQGRTPDCHCFGQIHSSPAGRGTLVRNVALAAPAVFVLAAGPGPALDGWLSAGHGHPIVLAALVAAGLVVALAARELARRAEERERAARAEPPGLAIGTPAPDFEVSDLEGGTVTLRTLTARGRPLLLVFTHEGCGPCGWLMPDLARWQAALAEKLTVGVISGGEESSHRRLKAEHRFGELLLQDEMEVFRSYRMTGTPAAVLVSSEGRIDGASVAGSLAIEQLIRVALRRAETAADSECEAPAPFTSLRLGGDVVDPAVA